MKDNNSSEEIDLLSILRSIKKKAMSLFQLAGELINFYIKNIKILVLYIMLGITVSTTIFFLRKPVYDSFLTMSHIRLNNGQCADFINSLTSTLDKETTLVDKLKIDHKLAKQIKSISYKPIADNDSLLKLTDFKIEVKVYDAAILDTLQKKILNFLESNEYATKRKEINKLYLDKFEEKIKREVIAIDSLKHIVDKSILPRSLGNGIILGESIDPVKVYQEGMNLYKSQLNINELRELNNSFEVIVGFSPATPTPSSNIIINILAGLVFGLILGFLMLRNKYRLTK